MSKIVLRILAATLLGGAMAGSVIVGLVDAYGRWLLPEFSYFMIFGPMAILLLVRPTGFFGREA